MLAALPTRLSDSALKVSVLRGCLNPVISK